MEIWVAQLIKDYTIINKDGLEIQTVPYLKKCDKCGCSFYYPFGEEDGYKYCRKCIIKRLLC